MIYIWECLNGKRTVVHQAIATIVVPVRFAAKMETAACGQVTEFEKAHEIENGTSKYCRRTDLQWMFAK
jgi:hypothetical protein